MWAELRRLYRLLPLFCAGALLCVGLPLWGNLPLSAPEANELLKIGQAPTVSEISSFTHADFRWHLTQAQNALAAGLPTVAQMVCLHLEETWNSVPEEIPAELSLCHIDSLIALGKREQAQHLLEQRPNLNSSARNLRLALIYEQDRLPEKAREALNNVRSIDLETGEWFWYYLVQAFVAEESSEEILKEEFLQQAQNSIESPMQKILWDLFFLHRLQIEQDITDDLLNQLKEKTIQFTGGQLGFQFARQYALALDSLGRTEEALAVVDVQLQSLHGSGSEEEDLFRLLTGILAGPQSGRGAENLRRLVASGRNHDWQSLALYLLAQTGMQDGYRNEFVNFLDVMLDREDEHPLLDAILFLRAQAAQLEGREQQAAALANRLLEQFPGSPLLKSTLYLLARNAWEDSPQRLRDTAELLLRYRDLINSPSNRAWIQILLGDVYFLNRDYMASRNSYAAAIRELQDENMRGLALFQLIQTYLATDDLTGAIDALNQEESTLPVEWRWRVHWNLLIAMRQMSMQREAFQRINLLLSERDTASEILPLSLRWRFQWLKADLSLIDGRPDETLVLTTQLLDSLEQKKEETDQETFQHLLGHTLLIRAQAYFQENLITEAMTTLQQIQDSPSGEELSVLALLLKARFHESRNQLVEAQSALQEIGDLYPQSKYAPLALFEAAAKAEQRGLPASFDQAIALLERIIRNYPDQRRLRFQARLRQGEILRKMSQFASAAGVYRTLMQQARNDLEQYTAQLHLAYCLIALGNLDQQNLEDARSYLERIRQIRTLPADLRAEAGFQEGFILRRLNKETQALEVLGEVSSEWFRSTQPPAVESNQFGPLGRYWSVRATLELADILESRNSYEEAMRLYAYLNELSVPGISSLVHSRIERIKKSPLGIQNTP